MEFPEDVLTIIRAYAKPLLRFSDEFRLILIELGLRDWHEVRVKLCSPEAEPVMIALRAYRTVQLEASFRLKEAQRPRYPRLLSSSQIDHVKCIQLRNKLYQDLQTLLGPVLEEYPDERYYRYLQPTLAPERPIS